MNTVVDDRAAVNQNLHSSDNLPLSKKRSFASASAKLQPALEKLLKQTESETDFEPSEAYWRGLWDRAELGQSHETVVTTKFEKPKNGGEEFLVVERARRPGQRQSQAKLQVQGSVVRLKTIKARKGEAGATFERGWDQSPDMWGENFLLDGYDRLNPHDRAQYVKKPKTGNKSDIKEFSPASRRNLLDKMCSLLLECWLRAWFVTLTYHNEWPDPKGTKKHLRAFYKRICYYAKKNHLDYKPSIIWRVEPQKRGAPHFHLFVFNAPKIPKYMLLQWWQEITNDPTITQVDREFLTTRRKAMNYLSKYISKDKYSFPSEGCEAAQLDIALYWAKAGRYWGSEGLTDAMFAVTNELIVELLDDGLLRFVAMMETAFPFLADRWSFGFRVFTYDKPASSIWGAAALYITGEIVDDDLFQNEKQLTYLS